MRKGKPLAKSKSNVMGLVHPYRPDYRVQGNVPVGTTVYKAIRDACEAAGVRRRLINYGIAQVGRRDYEKNITVWEFLPFSKWKKHKLATDELLRFRILPKGGGGGGGKGGLNTILNIIVAVAAIAAATFTAGASIFAEGAALAGWGTFAGGLAGMAVLTIGQALVNAIAPVSAASIGGLPSYNTTGISSEKEADVYSISGGRNSVNQWGRVPVPVGRGRFAPPKAAAPYTENIGEDQFLHELFCLGIGDMQFSGIKIGTTPIEQYEDAQWEIIQSENGSPIPQYYPTGVYEETLDIQLEEFKTVSRATQECTYAIIDFSFNGLCELDDYGNPGRASVDFEINYQSLDGGPITSVGNRRFHNGIDAWRPPLTGGHVESGVGTVLVSHTAGIEVRWYDGEGGILDTEYRLGFLDVDVTYYDQVSGYAKCTFRPDTSTHGVQISGFNVTTRDGALNTPWGLSVSSGYTTMTVTDGSAVQGFTVEGAQTRLLRKSYKIDFPRKGIYQINITRRTRDPESTRSKGESFWTALRSGSNEAPVKTDYPVMLLSLMVKASGQISGAIDTLTVYYETKCLDYNGSSWVWRYTSNSAAIMLYLLIQQHCWAFPQNLDHDIDLPSFVRAYKYCSEKKFKFDKVLDSSDSLYERLVSVGASCLASPTIIDGRWGIIIDAPRENVVCAFTSANAWSWSFERTQVKLPQAVHCNFVNEATWESDMRVVETGEPLDGHYLYETQTYDGVTDPDQVWLLARFHYADAKRRRRTISFTAYDEAIMCSRGDLVELCCPNVGVQGLQVGRIRKVNRNSAGYVTSVTTDQLNQTDFSGRTFGAKIWNNSGATYHVRIKAENKAHRVLTFLIPQKIDIQPDNKYALGDYKEETFQAIVLGMKFNSDWTCNVTCQDYDEFLYGSLEGEIPDFESVITQPIELRWTLSSIPIIVNLVSDERVVTLGSNGTIVCRILAYMADPPDLDPRAAYYNLQIRKVLDDDGITTIYDNWHHAVRGESIELDSVYINDVDEGATYEIRARYTGKSGEYGQWCKPVRHRVDGSLAPPPDVTNFKATITNPEGIWLTWDNITWVHDIKHYRLWGACGDLCVLASPYLYKPWRQTGLLEFWIVAVDYGGRESLHPAHAECTVYPPKDAIIDNAELLEEGVIASWQDCFTTWDINYYNIRVRNFTGRYKTLNCVIPWSGRFYKNEPFWVRALDIFENWAVNDVNRIVTIYPPLTPKIRLGFDKTNGKVTIDWQDCKNPTKPNTPRIDYYEITGTLAMGDPVQVKGLHYESIVPLIVYEFGAHTVPGGIPVNVGNLHIQVTAVDKYGITSKDADDYKDNSVDMELLPPYNPTDFGVSAVVASDNETLEAQWTQSTAIMLTWRDCERTLAIDYYRVYDSYTHTEYKIATNYIVLPARPHGTYPITVQAFDVLGLSSAEMTYNLSIGGVGGMEVTAKLDGADIYLEWTTPDATFKIDHYIILEDNDDLPTGTNSDQNMDGYLGEAKVNYYRMPAGKAGTYTYYVWAVDVAGNINTDFANYASVTIEPNAAPNIQAKVEGIGVGLQWTRTEHANTLPVAQWEVRRYQHLANTGLIPTSTPVQDYGRLDVTKTTVDAFIKDNYTFTVRAIDTGGNYGAWGACDFNVQSPGRVSFTKCFAVHNNVQLYWSNPDKIFFAIKEYIFAEYDKDTNMHMEIGRIDANFASESETQPGDYTYSITPVDWGGNLGTPTTISLSVSYPPDFQYFNQFESLFNGTKTNMLLDGRGHMTGPYKPGETWVQNKDRASQLSGKTITTHKQKVDAGYVHWPEPIYGTGGYVETINHGMVTSSCLYTVTIDYVAVSGHPVITCKIEVSRDNKTWRTATTNGLQVLAEDFQYSRITLGITGGLVQINHIYVNLQVKRVQDYGRVHCDKDDNDLDWVSETATPMLTGTWVAFHQKFIDVQALPKPNVLNHENYTAYTVFEDVLRPKGFRVFVKDKSGNRVTADVDWVASGV